MVQQRTILDWSDLGEPSGVFEPKPFYDPETDSLTLYVSDDESYRERVDGYLTVYRSIASKKLVGCHIKCVRKVLESASGFLVDIQTERTTLGILLMAAPWAEIQDEDTEPIRCHVYKEIAELSKTAGNTPVELAGAC